MISIRLANGCERELKTKLQLEGLLTQHNLSKWLYTDNILIDRGSIPHSHPILTMHVRHLGNDNLLLSTFIHEQIHWHLESKLEQANKAIEELCRRYGTVPVGFPEGGQDEYSTYLHLIVNYLEFESLKELIGDDTALDIMEFWCNDHYTWVYRKVLEDFNELRDVIIHYKLGI